MKQVVWLSMEPKIRNDAVVGVENVRATINRPTRRSLMVKLVLDIPDAAFAPFVARIALDPGDLSIDVTAEPPDPDSDEFETWANAGP